jgi:hypothetical protein
MAQAYEIRLSLPMLSSQLWKGHMLDDPTVVKPNNERDVAPVLLAVLSAVLSVPKDMNVVQST